MCMVSVTSVIDGLVILSNYTESENLTLCHDQICFELEDIEVAPIDKRTLTDLGWVCDNPDNIWKIYV